MTLDHGLEKERPGGDVEEPRLDSLAQQLERSGHVTLAVQGTTKLDLHFGA